MPSGEYAASPTPDTPVAMAWGGGAEAISVGATEGTMVSSGVVEALEEAGELAGTAVRVGRSICAALGTATTSTVPASTPSAPLTTTSCCWLGEKTTDCGATANVISLRLASASGAHPARESAQTCSTLANMSSYRPSSRPWTQPRRLAATASGVATAPGPVWPGRNGPPGTRAVAPGASTAHPPDSAPTGARPRSGLRSRGPLV